MRLTALAPGKTNLCLFLGPTRADGRHELLTLFDSVTLYDELSVEPAGSDHVACQGVAGPNLVADALSALRAAGWTPEKIDTQLKGAFGPSFTPLERSNDVFSWDPV